MSAGGLDVYRWVIAPMAPEQFEARFYERAVCLIRRGDPSYFADLLTVDQLDHVLTTGLARHPEISLVQHEKTITASDYADGDGRIDPVRATRLFRQGATIIFTHLHERIPSLGRLCAGLERAFSSRMQTNIYLTPPAAQGFAPHWDTHDVFILQIAGRKQWTIYGTKIPLPLQNQHFDRTVDAVGDPTMEFALEPGDVCYIPRGVIHAAVASADTSLHITTGLIAYTWTDLLLQAVVAAGMNEVELRQNLPMGWPQMVDDDDRLARDYRARVERLVAQLAAAPPPFGVLADNLTADYNSLAFGRLRRAIESNRLTLASAVRLRDDAEVQPAGDPALCSVRCGTKEFEMPIAVLPALEYLHRHKPCAIGALPDVIDDDSKLVLVRRLMAEGVVDAVS